MPCPSLDIRFFSSAVEMYPSPSTSTSSNVARYSFTSAMRLLLLLIAWGGDVSSDGHNPAPLRSKVRPGATPRHNRTGAPLVRLPRPPGPDPVRPPRRRERPAGELDGRLPARDRPRLPLPGDRRPRHRGR